MKKKFAVKLISLIGLLLSSCNLFKPSVESVSIEGKVNEIEAGQTFQLEAKVSPSNAKSLEVTWKSSNEDVVSITDTGFVSALSLGSTTIEAISKQNKSKKDSFELKVTESTLEKTKLKYTYDDYTANNMAETDNCPLEGNPKLLIVPIWFYDSSSFIDVSKKEAVRNDIEKAYLGTPSDTGWHSVKSYYEAESFNKITLSGTVTDWYNVAGSYTTYASENEVSKTVELVKKVSDNYFSNSGDNRKDYDSNNDGFLDGVILIYAAPDNMSLENEEYQNLWAYCYWTSENSNKSKPAAKSFFWASYDFFYGSNAVAKTGHEYAHGYTENGVDIDTHCLIHEMGHVFGLQDYYDYSEHQYNPAGGFSMQDYNVGGHDPYSVMAYGWADPYIPDKTMTISLGDFQSTHDVILLANHSIDGSPFDEYLLLEYYTPTGLNERDSRCTYRETYPKGPNVGGIRLWHVDARLFHNYPTASNLTNDPTVGYVYHAMANSYGGNNASMFGPTYYNYNILQLIRNDVSETYKPYENLSSSSLFKSGDNFEMSKFSSQFVNGSKMNNKKALGWSFKVVSIAYNKATISLTKI